VCIFQLRVDCFVLNIFHSVFNADISFAFQESFNSLKVSGVDQFFEKPSFEIRFFIRILFPFENAIPPSNYVPSKIRLGLDRIGVRITLSDFFKKQPANFEGALFDRTVR